MAPPTDYSTVYTTLKRVKECVNALGQTHTPVYFDMDLLTKALEITWAKPVDLQGVISCEGGIHFLMAVFAGIGYLYGDAGLRELLFECDVFAMGSVQQILSGKDKAMRAFKLIDEALTTRSFIQFKRWCSSNNKTIPDGVHDYLHELLNRLSEAESDTDSINEILAGRLGEVVHNDLLPLLSEFREEGKSISPTFRFWNEFLDRIMLPFKLFLSSTRLGLWDVHQFARKELLPLMFASNRSTYARYMSYLVLQMQYIPEEAADGFKEGLFAAKLSEGKFNSVWIDYVLENKALKGTGRIIGLTLKGNALARWFLARPATAKYSMTFHKDVCQSVMKLNANEPSPHSYSNATQKRFDADVKKLIQMFDGRFIDPFGLRDPTTHITNFATGVVTSGAVGESLLGALEKGKTWQTAS